MWGATWARGEYMHHYRFQSAHPYVGCDCAAFVLLLSSLDFNPRTPMWGATGGPVNNWIGAFIFQSAHPYVGCDTRCGSKGR